MKKVILLLAVLTIFMFSCEENNENLTIETENTNILARKTKQVYCTLTAESFGVDATVLVDNLGAFYYIGATGQEILISSELATGYCSNWSKATNLQNRREDLTWTTGNCTYQSQYIAATDSYTAPQLINSVCNLGGTDPLTGETYHPHYSTHNCSCN